MSLHNRGDDKNVVDLGGIVDKKLGSRVAYPRWRHMPLAIDAVGLLLANVTSMKSLSGVKLGAGP
ncbi:MAG: hypothetical protein Q3981_07015 [Corynebacterium sp.]|nr:hypothetical protein [Corynebacterium sp.]